MAHPSRGVYANAGTVDITPGGPMPLAGAETRTGAFQGIAGRLEANALVLREDGLPVVLVTVDLIFVGQELRSGILQRLGGALPEERLFLAASHTHFAPATDDRRPHLGRLHAGYLEEICDRIAGLVRGLLGAPAQPAVLEYVRGEADHSVNRRLRTPWQLSRRGLLLDAVVAAPNHAGPRDETVHVIRIAGSAGELIAVLWSYACHPVAYPLASSVSPEYPGAAREGLRRELGAGLPILFLQGFAGDIRPRAPAPRPSRAARVRRALLGPRFVPVGINEWRAWAGSLTERVVEIAAGAAMLSAVGPVSVARISRSLADFVLGADPGQVTFHGLAFGPALVIAGISAEVVSEYGPPVREAFAPAITIPVGYIDEVYGYLPTSRMLEEGGYEASWFLEPFSLRGPLHGEIEAHTLSAIEELAASLTAHADSTT